MGKGGGRGGGLPDEEDGLQQGKGRGTHPSMLAVVLRRLQPVGCDHGAGGKLGRQPGPTHVGCRGRGVGGRGLLREERLQAGGGAGQASAVPAVEEGRPAVGASAVVSCKALEADRTLWVGLVCPHALVQVAAIADPGDFPMKSVEKMK